MLEYLGDIFFIVSNLILSATITSNILNYIQVFLKLFLFSRIYRLSLDHLIFKYIVYFIQKSGFWNLVFLVSKDSQINEILTIMVFVNKIQDVIKLEKYLWSRLPDCICNRSWIYMVIQSITSNLDDNTRTKCIENL